MPDGFGLCMDKMEYLQARWYGSNKEVIAFGRECTANTNWVGQVRLVLVEAHTSVSQGITDNAKRADYWKQKEVWADIQMAYEQFFKLYPDQAAHRPYYVRYAWWCGQWQEFIKLAKALPATEHYFFNGTDALNGMIQFASDQVKKK
jgi:hypothetical protein